MSVFRDIINKSRSTIKAQTDAIDMSVISTVYSRFIERWLSKVRISGADDPYLALTLPRVLLTEGKVGVFIDDDGALTAFPFSRIGAPNKYGYATDMELSPLGVGGVRFRNESEVITIRANNDEIAPLTIVAPLLERMAYTMRCIDLVTAKKGVSIFATPSAIEENTLNELSKKIYSLAPFVGVRRNAVSSIEKLPLFEGTTSSLGISELWESYRAIEAEIHEMSGESTITFEKKERLITTEVDHNEERITHDIFGIYLDNLKRGIEEVNERFGTSWSVAEMKGGDGDGMESFGTISERENR